MWLCAVFLHTLCFCYLICFFFFFAFVFFFFFFFFSSRRRHTRSLRDWSSDVCSSDLFLVMHLGPVVSRREEALSRLTPGPRFVKLNTDALLRMDPSSRADKIGRASCRERV